MITNYDVIALIPAALVPYVNLLIEYATHFMWTSELVRIATIGNLQWISIAFLGLAIFPFLYKLYLKSRVVIDPDAPPVLKIKQAAAPAAPPAAPARGKRNPSRLVPPVAGESLEASSPAPAAAAEIPPIRYIYPDNTEAHGRKKEE